MRIFFRLHLLRKQNRKEDYWGHKKRYDKKITCLHHES